MILSQILGTTSGIPDLPLLDQPLPEASCSYLIWFCIQVLGTRLPNIQVLPLVVLTFPCWTSLCLRHLGPVPCSHLSHSMHCISGDCISHALHKWTALQCNNCTALIAATTVFYISVNCRSHLARCIGVNAHCSHFKCSEGATLHSAS